MFGALMFVSKILMEGLPNFHLIGVFTVAFTLVYRVKALIPIYVFVLITGLYNGFATWWIPYLYLWTVLWGIVMLLPKNMPKKVQPFVYCAVCALHGFAYGTLYAPFQALYYHYNLKQALAWIAAGLPWDAVHGVGNLILGILIVPLVILLRKFENVYRKK